ncbi:MAG: class I SAM-dependent methyltransferase [Candidatus Lokiarchaeota archaeon]|nr:class I SAM-dependent methyltransferase [Candidatus Lokiarchaeota archaeon]
MNDEYFDTNRKNWNERVEIHSKSKFYGLEKFKKTRNSLLRLEQKELGDVSGKLMLHLQCHFGMDSLSLANMGAIVTGVDFSDKAVELARSLSKELAIPANFIESNIYSLTEHLTGQFDIVFTSYGVLAWLPDLENWAKIINHFLKPGGFFYIIDGHPFGQLFDEKFKDHLRIAYNYFTEGQVEHYEDGYTYASDTPMKNKTAYEWRHPISSIINNLVNVGLTIEKFHEYPYSEYKSHPMLFKHEDGYYYFPPEFPYKVPLMFSLKAFKKEE